MISSEATNVQSAKRKKYAKNVTAKVRYKSRADGYAMREKTSDCC
mgnify:FL=1